MFVFPAFQHVRLVTANRSVPGLMQMFELKETISLSELVYLYTWYGGFDSGDYFVNLFMSWYIHSYVLPDFFCVEDGTVAFDTEEFISLLNYLYYNVNFYDGWSTVFDNSLNTYYFELDRILTAGNIFHTVTLSNAKGLRILRCAQNDRANLFGCWYSMSDINICFVWRKIMRNRTYGKSALETRVDYVESKLDDTIKDFREAMQKSDKDFREFMQQMENRHQVNFAELKNSLEKIESKAESSRRWSIGIIVTIAVAVIGFMLTFIGFLFTHGFQAPS